MRKIKRISMALLLTGVLMVATGCGCTSRDKVNETTTSTIKSTTEGKGLVDDIGDDIKNGIDDIENGLNGNNGTTNNATTDNGTINSATTDNGTLNNATTVNNSTTEYNTNETSTTETTTNNR